MSVPPSSKKSVDSIEIPIQVKRIPKETAVVHFAGDSGDGMQLAGMQLTQTCASLGNDVQTFSDFPAEIRAPAGTTIGISGFQISFSDHRIFTPGDHCDVLIAMNPAAFRVSLPRVRSGGLVIVDEDRWTEKDWKKAHYTSDPLDSHDISHCRVLRIPITRLTLEALRDSALSRSAARKCKNMLVLGIVYWLYHRPLEETKAWLRKRFQEKPALAEANIQALRAGYHFAITAGLFAEHYEVPSAPLPAGRYRHITGNQALAWGCVAAAVQAEQTVLVCGYPITPASDILHLLAGHAHWGVKTFQAEDEIAAIGAAIGASFGGALALTATSGPGLDLKSEALGLAVMAELPLVIVDVQRAGPSTGMPTKVEQSDLLAAVFGRHGECPVPVIAPATPGECFDFILEAFRLAVRYMTPIVMLSDATLANGAAPWRIPEKETLPDLRPCYHQDPNNFAPYARNAWLARPWAIPGTPGLTHRIGGLEKEAKTGNISYDPDNHQTMVATRQAKVTGIAEHLPPLEVLGPSQGTLLVIGWGSTLGVIRTAVTALQKTHAVSAVHLRYLYPLQNDLELLLGQFQKTVVVEMNQGQLCHLLRARFLKNIASVTKVAGKPFGVKELQEKLMSYLEP